MEEGSALPAQRCPGLPAPTRLRQGVAGRHGRTGHGGGRAPRQGGIGPLGVPVLGVHQHRAAVLAVQRGIAEGPSLGITRGRAPSSSPLVLVSDTTANIIVHAGPHVMGLHIPHAGRKRATLPDRAASLTTIHCSTAFCWQVTDHLAGLPSHPEAPLWPRAVGTVGLLQARTGVGNRTFSRWLTRDARARFPQRGFP